MQVGNQIVVCVCTRERPQMLDACLLSLMRQRTPEGASVAAVAVDNEPAPNNQAEVERFAGVFPFPLHYVHQPDQGIPQARNAALEKALELGADWICFLDDDEEATAEWLVRLHGALARHGHRCGACGAVEGPDVVLGPVRYVFPEGAQQWRQRGQYGDWGRADGDELPSAATNNVIFRAALVREAGLRFDVGLRFAGGEDVLFFRRMKAAGARIVWAADAIVTETVPWERITLRGHIRKSYRKGASAVMSARLFGRRRDVQRLARKALRRAGVGLVKIAVAPLALLLGPSPALHALMSGCRGVAEAAGVTAALCGRQSDYYRRVTGY
jgi:succinoglycan biosynthesis protein ExoM